MTSSTTFALQSDLAPTFLRLAILISGIIVALSLLHRTRTPRDKAGNIVPPGPRGLPIIGGTYVYVVIISSLLTADSSGVFPYLAKYPELSLHKWAKQYGPLYSFVLGDQRIVVLSDPNVVKDILVTNGAIFSSRKDMFLKVEIVLAHRGITASGYNETWLASHHAPSHPFVLHPLTFGWTECRRKHRRIAAKILTTQAVATYAPAIEFEAKEMIYNLFVDGKAGAAAINPQPYASRSSLNNILMVVYGVRTESMSDPVVKEVLRISREFMYVAAAVPVDFRTSRTPWDSYIILITRLVGT